MADAPKPLHRGRGRAPRVRVAGSIQSRLQARDGALAWGDSARARLGLAIGGQLGGRSSRLGVVHGLQPVGDPVEARRLCSKAIGGSASTRPRPPVATTLEVQCVGLLPQRSRPCARPARLSDVCFRHGVHGEYGASHGAIRRQRWLTVVLSPDQKRFADAPQLAVQSVGPPDVICQPFGILGASSAQIPTPMPRNTSNNPSASLLDLPAGAIPSGTATDKALLSAATKEAYKRVNLLLSAYFEDFSPVQQRRIREAIGAKASPKPPKQAKAPKAPKAPKEDLPPRFWLPFSGETWSGRGRPPAAFLAWEGTVAHTEWKKHHPGERFPIYPA